MFWSSCWFFFSFHLLCSALADELYVTAYPNGDPCPHGVVKNCHNLSYYLKEKDRFFKSNTTFNFLQGIHQLQPNQTFIMENLTNISFVGLGDIVVGSDELVTQSTSVLKCSSEQGTTESGGINFVNCVDITIRRITLAECNHSPALLVNASTNIDLFNLSIMNSIYGGENGYGLHIINSNNVSIMNSVITNCTTGASVTFQSINSLPLNEQEFNFHIESVNITQNNGTGLKVEFLQENYFVNFQMESCNFVKQAVDFEILSSSCNYSLQIHTLISKYSLRALGLVHSSSCHISTMPMVYISESTFSSSISDLVAVFVLLSRDNTTGIFSVTSSTFSNNVGVSILQIISKTTRGMENLYNQQRSYFNVYIANTTFKENRPDSSLSIQACAHFTNIENVFMTNCTFADNDATAIEMFNSAVAFEGASVFRNNRALNTGGAMNIIGNSYIKANAQSHMVFIDNYAGMYGGAIYVDGKPAIAENNEYLCFYQSIKRGFIEGKIFTFVNNTANIAGTAVYAENIGNCFLLAENLVNVNDTAFFLGISSITQSGDSVISSSPQKVCFCDNDMKNCSSIGKYYYNIYPGEIIEFSVVAVGSNDGSTPGTIRIDNYFASVPQTKLEALPSTACTAIRYTVISKLPIKVDDVQFLYITLKGKAVRSDLFIRMEISDCKKGFHLSPKTHTCDCIEDISYHATCYPSKQLIERSNKIYVGYNDLQNCAIVSSNCPFDYCISKATNITLNNSYVQCSENRAGQLCGSCFENFSLVLGSNACKDCRGKQGFLSLILPFAMAGIALVFLLLFLNFTVSVGTINGLVFLANIEKIYEPFLSSECSIPFLSQFIAWINLDLGIETCFFDGMSAVVKVSLQFVFPLYVWLIITMIIVVSKYSSRLAHYIGNNGIPVLATLILLSYTKLINAVILVLSRISVKCGDHATIHWFVDPTQEYLTGGHTVLFVIALIVMVLLIVPYTLFLLLYPFQGFLSESCRQRMSWAIFRLKPFFDAYRGPYTDVFCIWPGILLVVRIVLSLVVSQTEDATISFSILVPLLIVIISTLSSSNVYRNKYLHLVDAGYIVVLLLLSYLKIVITNDEAIYYCNTVVLSLSFLVFSGTLLFHVFKYSAIKKICNYKMKGMEMPPLVIQRSSGYSTTEYREPLISTN